MPTLVVVSGASASGKTTLSTRLAKDLAIPLISKDSVKELLFETLPQYDRNWSTIEGRMSIAMMYAGARQLLNEGYHGMIESAFHSDFAKDDIASATHESSANIIEVYCMIDDATRNERWRERIKTTRHSGHLDDSSLTLVLRPSDGPIYPSTAIVIDTGLPADVYEKQYAELVKNLHKKLGAGERYATTN